MIALIAVIEQYFWLIGLIVTVGSAFLAGERSAPLRRLAPDRYAPIDHFVLGYVLVNIAFWGSMGYGILVEDIPSIFSYFEPTTDHPFIPLAQAAWIVGASLLVAWIAFFGGASSIAGLPLPAGPSVLAEQLTLWCSLCLFGICALLVLLWFSLLPLIGLGVGAAGSYAAWRAIRQQALLTSGTHEHIIVHTPLLHPMLFVQIMVLLIAIFGALGLVQQAIAYHYYQTGQAALQHGDWFAAQTAFRQAGQFRDARGQLKESYYQQALEALRQQQWDIAAETIVAFEGVDLDPDYRDLPQRIAATPSLQQAVARRRSAAWQRGQLHLVRRIQAYDSVNSIACSPDGTLLAVGTGARVGAIQLRDMRSGEQITTLQVQEDAGSGPYGLPIFGIHFSDDGHWMVSSNGNALPHTLSLWDMREQKIRWTVLGDRGRLRPDGHILAGITSPDTITLWSVPTGRAAQRLTLPTGRVENIVWSPNGQWMAIKTTRAIGFWRSGDAMPSWTINLDEKTSASMAFSADGQLFASSRDDHTIGIWHVSKGTLLRTLPMTIGIGVMSMTFSPDGHLLAGSGGQLAGGLHLSHDRGAIQLWRVADGTLLQIMHGHSDWITSIAFSPDSRTLAAGSGDSTITFWRP